MKKLLIVIVLVLLSSCRTKEIVRTVTEKDTIKIDRIVKITPEQLDEIVFEDVCDSLTGLKPFRYTTTSNVGEVSVEASEGDIRVEIDRDSLYQVWEKEYVSRNRQEKEVITVKEKYIPKFFKWLLRTSLTINALLLIWIFRGPLLKIIKRYLNPLKLKL